MNIKKPNKFIELIANTLHIYSAKTYKDGSIVFCNYIKKEYYENGQLKKEMSYVNDKEHGILKYYENGQVKYECPYVLGNKHGTVKWYYITGELQYECPYDNDKEHGIYKEYYENGQLKEESRYVLGELIDTSNYDENGNLIIKK